jgi:hypothetical protein
MSSENLRATTWWDHYGSAVEAGETHRAELLVRSLSPTPGGHDRRRRVFERLEEAVGTHVDRYDITIVGEEFCLCESCIDTVPGTRLLEKFTRIREYRDGTAHSLSFAERTIDAMIIGETYRLLAPPELCLTVYVDGELEGVFPRVIGGETFGPEEYLEALTADTAQSRPFAVDV